MATTDYRAAIDLAQNILRPPSTQAATDLIPDIANSSGVTIKGDMVLLNYTSTPFITQEEASEYINVNPFDVTTNRGIIQLSPASDDWVETQYRPAAVTTGATRIINNTGLLWDSWIQNWYGRANEIAIDTVESNTYTDADAGWTYTDTIRATSELVVRENIEDKLLEKVKIDWMRSRRVYFKCYGFKPFTRVFAFFDGQSVDSWIKLEPFKYKSENTTQYGQLYCNNTEHPFGSTSILVTDGEGVIEGSFFIPSSRAGVVGARRFRTGAREFRLMDISQIDESQATNVATAMYTATGILETKQESWTSVRQVIVTGSTTKVKYYPPVVEVVGGKTGGVVVTGGGEVAGSGENYTDVSVTINTEASTDDDYATGGVFSTTVTDYGAGDGAAAQNGASDGVSEGMGADADASGGFGGDNGDAGGGFGTDGEAP